MYLEGNVLPGMTRFPWGGDQEEKRVPEIERAWGLLPGPVRPGGPVRGAQTGLSVLPLSRPRLRSWTPAPTWARWAASRASPRGRQPSWLKDQI